MNQVSAVPFGSDATQFCGVMQSANSRLGAIDVIFENTGPSYALIRLAQYDGSTSPSGFATIDTSYTTTAASTTPGEHAPVAGFKGFAVAPGGTVTRHYVLLNKTVAFFGSGNTVVNISTVLRNKSDLRGAQVDIVAVGEKSWGYEEGWTRAELTKKWGSVAGPGSTSSNINAGSGIIDPDGTAI